jgi:hypothetical protein
MTPLQSMKTAGFLVLRLRRIIDYKNDFPFENLFYRFAFLKHSFINIEESIVNEQGIAIHTYDVIGKN